MQALTVAFVTKHRPGWMDAQFSAADEDTIRKRLSSRNGVTVNFSGAARSSVIYVRSILKSTPVNSSVKSMPMLLAS